MGAVTAGRAVTDHDGAAVTTGPRAGWRTTPGRLRAGVATAILLACALGALIAVFSGTVSSGFSAMGNTEAPQVLNSTGLYFSVSDMDAQVANVLLAGDTPAMAPGRQQDLTIYGQDRQTAEKDLLQVAATAAGNPAAERAAGSVLNALGQYETLAADAIQVNAAGHDPAGQPSQATLGYYRQATDLMANSVLPAAQALATDNHDALDTAYGSGKSSAQTGEVIVLVAGVALIAVLGLTQLHLTRHYHRLVNPGLAAATLVALGVTIAGAVQLGDQAQHLTVAKSEAFDSIYALSQARAISYSANADESRYLVDPARAARYQDSFLAKSQEVADVGTISTVFQYDAPFAAEIKAYQANNADVGFGGYLGAEFRNITFSGERTAATRALIAFQVYERDDRQLRALDKTNLDQAIAFDVGTAPGQSDWAFGNWDAALGSVITINQDAFDSAIADGHRTGSGWNGVIPGAAVVVIAGLALAGARRRLTEYR
jgi:hypothetical protein